MDQVEKTEKIFYKYSAVKDSFIKNLENHQIYFNNPANFNDIADCKLYFYFEADKQRWIKEMKRSNEFRREQLERKAKERSLSTIDDLLNYLIDWCIKEGRFQLNGNLIYSDYDERWQSAKPLVSCFCGEGDNPVMWGIYANSSKGVCLGYRSKLIDTEYKITLDSKEEAFLKVRYEEKPPCRVNLFDEEDTKKVS